MGGVIRRMKGKVEMGDLGVRPAWRELISTTRQLLREGLSKVIPFYECQVKRLNKLFRCRQTLHLHA